MPIEMRPAKVPKALPAPPPSPETPAQPIPEPVAEVLPPETASGSTASAASADHLDGLSVAEPAGGTEQGPAPSGVDLGPSGFIPVEAFTATLTLTFHLSGGMLGLKSLSEAPGQQTYQPAAEALYHTIVDTPSMHFLIQPGSVWMQRMIAMGAFALPLGYTVRAELAERRKNRPQSAGKTPPPVAPQPGPSSPPQSPPQTMQEDGQGWRVVPGQSTRVGVLDTLCDVPC